MVLLFYFVDPTKSQKRGVGMETPDKQYCLSKKIGDDWEKKRCFKNLLPLKNILKVEIVLVDI